jgi:hypothetical protein
MNRIEELVDIKFLDFTIFLLINLNVVIRFHYILTYLISPNTHMNRIEELVVIDIKFLYGTVEPTIVVLYQDAKYSRHIKTYQISLSTSDVKEGPWSLPNVEKSAEMIITLPLPFGMIILFQYIAM